MDYSIFNSLNSGKKLSSADKANLFTERMSSTAHQREVEDLKKAGLNPILSADSSGATTGSAAEDSDDSTFDNPIYKLINNVNKVTNSTAKTYAQAVENLNKTVKQSLRVTNNAIKNSSDDNLRSSNYVKEELADELVNAIVKQASGNSGHSGHSGKFYPDINVDAGTSNSDKFRFNEKTSNGWNGLSPTTKSFLSFVGNVFGVNVKDAVNKNASSKNGKNGLIDEIAKIITFGQVDRSKGFYESGGIDFSRKYHSAKEAGGHSGSSRSFKTKTLTNMLNDTLDLADYFKENWKNNIGKVKRYFK